MLEFLTGSSKLKIKIKNSEFLFSLSYVKLKFTFDLAERRIENLGNRKVKIEESRDGIGMFPFFSTMFFFYFVLENVVECTWRCLSLLH